MIGWTYIATHTILNIQRSYAKTSLAKSQESRKSNCENSGAT